MKTENDVSGQLAALYEPHTVGTKIVGAASVGDPPARHQMPVAENPLKVPALKDPVADAVVAVPEGWESTGPERMKHDQPQWVKSQRPAKFISRAVDNTKPAKVSYRCSSDRSTPCEMTAFGRLFCVFRSIVTLTHTTYWIQAFSRLVRYSLCVTYGPFTRITLICRPSPAFSRSNRSERWLLWHHSDCATGPYIISGTIASFRKEVFRLKVLENGVLVMNAFGLCRRNAQIC